MYIRLQMLVGINLLPGDNKARAVCAEYRMGRIFKVTLRIITDTGNNVILKELLDRLTAGYTEQQLQYLEEIFVACSRYEAGFWDMAWNMRK